MENENIKEDQITSEVEETEIVHSNEENTGENSFSKVILANILDQSLVLAGSAILLLLSDVVLRLFGYMFVRETGAIVLAGGIIYFVLNCIYTPVMEKSKAKNTIGKKILSIN